MKAVVHTHYGPPEVAKLMEVPQPIPKDNEVLVKVYSSTVCRTDSGLRSAEYVFPLVGVPPPAPASVSLVVMQVKLLMHFHLWLVFRHQPTH